MTREEKSLEIDKLARKICLDGGDRRVLIEEITQYWVNDVLRIDMENEQASEKQTNRELVNFYKLFLAIQDAVNKYDPVSFPDISITQLVGDTIRIRKSNIFRKPIFGYDAEPPEDTPLGVDIVRYYKLCSAISALGFTMSDLTEEDIDILCEKLRIKRKDFVVAMRAGAIRHPGKEILMIYDSDAPSDARPSRDLQGHALFEYKYGLLLWFKWLAQNGVRHKQHIYKMINTNMVMDDNIGIDEYPDYTHLDYYEFALFLEYIDATIIRYLNSLGSLMSKQNFHATFRRAYNTHYKEFRSQAQV